MYPTYVVQLAGTYSRKALDRAMRGVVLTALKDEVKSWHLTTGGSAERLDVTGREVKAIFEETALANFSLRELNELALKAGLRVTLTVDKPEAT